MQPDNTFEEILTDFFDEEKSESEFQLGLALATMVDAVNNPEEYDGDTLVFIEENAQTLLIMWGERYDAEIKELHKRKPV